VTSIDLTDLWDLSGRVAIVTGASSGFGDRFSRVLAASGCQVVAAARRLDRLEALAAEVPAVLPVRTDVSVDDDCRALVRTALDRFGRIDVLVNNAGLSDAPDRAEEEDPQRFRDVIAVNLNAPFVLSSLVAAPMISAGRGGSIINVTSVHARVGSSPNNQAAYVASKGGLENLTRELALQWARHRIRVNAIAPGYFETELTAEMFTSDESGLGWIKRNTPMRRAGAAHELDGALLYLASDASSYMTGQVVAVEGGWLAR
jgi:NAD(P)-dependent dehydrogenase (short-subunit alcohol dehydrogenase family)